MEKTSQVSPERPDPTYGPHLPKWVLRIEQIVAEERERFLRARGFLPREVR